MTSLSTKTRPALFCGIFTLFFLKIRSEIVPNSTITGVQPPAEESPPRNTTWPSVTDINNIIVSTAGYNNETFPLNSTEKNRTASENVSGSESVTHKGTSFITTTAGEEKTTVAPALTTTMAPVLTSAQQNKSPNVAPVTARNLTTMLPKTDPQTPANTTLKHPAMTTSFSPITQNPTNTTSAATTVFSTVLPEKSKGLTSTAAVKETTLSGTTVKWNQSREFNQSSATTDLPTSATNGSALAHHTRTTENAINFSTSESPIKTSFFNISTTSAEIPSTNETILEPTNATQGGLFPVITKISHATTPNPTKLPETTQSIETEPCSSIGVAKKCLIVIASLAVVSTIFIISTVVLCTKLSSRKYKLKRQQRGTEMMCISSLLPERANHRPVRYTRQRSPVTNGVLVIHNGDDSDDEMGDNLTLSSFI